MAVAAILLCMLPVSEAVGDISELVADLLWVAPGCYQAREGTEGSGTRRGKPQ